MDDVTHTFVVVRFSEFPMTSPKRFSDSRTSFFLRALLSDCT